jgi:ribosomal protein S27AE
MDPNLILHAKHANKINWSVEYENGECPDCGEVIPPDAKEGEACKNCDHVFWKYRSLPTDLEN